MKWFKHQTDANRGRSISKAIDKFGHIGYSTYFILLELCYEKLDTNDTLFMEKCRAKGRVDFEFSLRLVRQNCRTSVGKLREVLTFYQTKALLEFELTPSEVRLFLPNLLEFLGPNDKTKIIKLIGDYNKINPDKKRGDKKREDHTGSKEPPKVIAPKRKVPRPMIPDITDPDILKYLTNISEESQKNWRKLYPDEYILREIVKIRGWLIDNPKKWPKSARGFSGFTTGWLNRGWNEYRKSIPSNGKQSTHQANRSQAERVINNEL